MQSALNRLDNVAAKLRFISETVALMAYPHDELPHFTESGAFGFALVTEDILKELEDIREQIPLPTAREIIKRGA